MCIEKGVNITVGAIGGSITCGHVAKSAYVQRLHDISIKENEKDSSAPALVTRNGAISATGADIPLSCFDRLIGSVDILISEFSLNEENEEIITQLYTAIEKLSPRPKLIVLDLFSELQGGPHHFQADNNSVYITVPTKIAMQRNLTVLSLRSALTPNIYNKIPPFMPHMIYPGTDKMHMNDIGHHLTAMIIYHYIRNNIMPRSGPCAIPAAAATALPPEHNSDICYTDWSVGNCPPAYRSGLQAQSLLDIAKPSPWWTKANRGEKSFLHTVYTNESMIGKQLELAWYTPRPCVLRLTAVLCNPELPVVKEAHACRDGSVDITYQGRTTRGVKLQKQGSSKVQRVIYKDSIAAGNHSLLIEPSAQSDTGYFGVELIGLYCSH
eukprot:gene37083-48423_t